MEVEAQMMFLNMIFVVSFLFDFLGDFFIVFFYWFIFLLLIYDPDDSFRGALTESYFDMYQGNM